MPEKLNFQPTERDFKILEAINRYRYLRTEQVKRLIAPENKSVEGIRRRLKYLFNAGFLGRITPFIQPGRGGASMAYYLEKHGAELLKDGGQTILSYSKTGQVKSMFLNHALDLSDFRILLETALKDHPFLFLKSFTADFELRSQTHNIPGNRKYKLYNEVVHPLNRRKYPVYPDGKIILQGKDRYAAVELLYFVEIDRGTETLGVIRDKVIGYRLYHQNLLEKTKDKGAEEKKNSLFKVFFQCNSPKRAKNIRNSLTDAEGSELVWVTDVSKVNEKSLLYEPIWTDVNLKRKSILKPL